MAKKVNGKDDVLALRCWPQLRLALRDERLAMLGCTPEEIALFLIIDGVEKRLTEFGRNRAAADRRAAAAMR